MSLLTSKLKIGSLLKKNCGTVFKVLNTCVTDVTSGRSGVIVENVEKKSFIIYYQYLNSEILSNSKFIPRFELFNDEIPADGPYT